jgi:hypothetical protein
MYSWRHNTRDFISELLNCTAHKVTNTWHLPRHLFVSRIWQAKTEHLAFMYRKALIVGHELYVREDPICLWIGRKYCPIGSGVVYIEVRRNIILSCFFRCLKEGEVLWSQVLCVLCVLCHVPNGIRTNGLLDLLQIWAIWGHTTRPYVLEAPQNQGVAQTEETGFKQPVSCNVNLHENDCLKPLCSGCVYWVLRPATSAQVFPGFPVSKTEC